MVEVDELRAKIAECGQLVDASKDPLTRDVYRAMSAEFLQKLRAARRPLTQATEAVRIKF